MEFAPNIPPEVFLDTHIWINMSLLSGVLVLVAENEYSSVWTVHATEFGQSGITKYVKVLDITECVQLAHVTSHTSKFFFGGSKGFSSSSEFCGWKQDKIIGSFYSQVTRGFINIYLSASLNNVNNRRHFSGNGLSAIANSNFDNYRLVLFKANHSYILHSNPSSLVLLKSSYANVDTLFRHLCSEFGRCGLILCCFHGLIENIKSNESSDDPATGNYYNRPLWNKLPKPVFPLLGVPLVIVGGWLLWRGMWRVHYWFCLMSYGLLIVGWSALGYWFVFFVHF